MKALALEVGIDPQKVYPHNLRRLFARRFYKRSKNLAMLADILGHRNISTTRRYVRETSEEQSQAIDALGLVLDQEELARLLKEE